MQETATVPLKSSAFVPDDVATIEIAGTTINVTDNVWHYTGHVGDDLTFKVVSDGGTLTACHMKFRRSAESVQTRHTQR